MTAAVAGPGVLALAELSGHPAETLARDPLLAVRALATVSRDLLRLAADRSSPDPAVRAAASRRAAEVADIARRLDVRPEGSAAGDAFRERLRLILEQVVRDLEEPIGSPDGTSIS